jgi:hypothetical protein
VKTITIEVEDAVAERIEEVVRLRAGLGEPTTAEALAGAWLSSFIRQRLPTDLVRFRGLEGTHATMTRQHGWGR